MKDYIFYRNLRKNDLIDEFTNFYKGEFELKDFYPKKDEFCYCFSGVVHPDTTKTEEYKSFAIEGEVSSQTLKWTEKGWDKAYCCASDKVVNRVQQRLAQMIVQNYKTRGYKILDDFDSKNSQLSL